MDKPPQKVVENTKKEFISAARSGTPAASEMEYLVTVIKCHT